MNKQAQNRFKNYYALIINFREHQLKKGVSYRDPQAKAEKKLASWIKDRCQCSRSDETKIEELISDIVMAKEDEIICLLADLEAIKIDNDRLPRMKIIATSNQICGRYFMLEKDKELKRAMEQKKTAKKDCAFNYTSYGELCRLITQKYTSFAEFSKKVLNLPLKEFERILKGDRQLTIGQMDKIISDLKINSGYLITQAFFDMFEIK